MVFRRSSLPSHDPSYHLLQNIPFLIDYFKLVLCRVMERCRMGFRIRFEFLRSGQIKRAGWDIAASSILPCPALRIWQLPFSLVSYLRLALQLYVQ